MHDHSRSGVNDPTVEFQGLSTQTSEVNDPRDSARGLYPYWDKSQAI